jgi:hypothetical protein
VLLEYKSLRPIYIGKALPPDLTRCGYAEVERGQGWIHKSLRTREQLAAEAAALVGSSQETNGTLR